MKKSNLKMLAFGLIATLAITSCDVRRPRHGRPDHRRDRDHQDNQRGDRGGDHNDRNY